MALFGFGIHLVRHVSDTQHERKRQALRRTEFFRAVMSKIAVLHVVMADGAHFMHVAETAVMVGQDETVAAHHLTSTSATENADAFAERRSCFAVECRRGQLQTGLAERILKVLLLHEFEKPHTLVGMCSCKAHNESHTEKNDFLHCKLVEVFGK